MRIFILLSAHVFFSQEAVGYVLSKEESKQKVEHMESRKEGIDTGKRQRVDDE